MCLTTLQTGPLIATEDITIYKVLRKTISGCYYSPYRGMEYILNKRYCMGDRIPKLKSTSLGRGVLHSYLSLQGAKDDFHIKYTKYAVIVQGYIPKGTKYWIGYGKPEAASRSLVLTEEISK